MGYPIRDRYGVMNDKGLPSSQRREGHCRVGYVKKTELTGGRTRGGLRSVNVVREWEVPGGDCGEGDLGPVCGVPLN